VRTGCGFGLGALRKGEASVLERFLQVAGVADPLDLADALLGDIPDVVTLGAEVWSGWECGRRQLFAHRPR